MKNLKKAQNMFYRYIQLLIKERIPYNSSRYNFDRSALIYSTTMLFAIAISAFMMLLVAAPIATLFAITTNLTSSTGH